MIDRLYYLIEQGLRSAPNTEETREVKEEIRLNIEEKYNDLIGEGKTPQEAYEIIAAGLGDFNELVEELRKSQSYRDKAEQSEYTEGGGAVDVTQVDKIDINWVSGNVTVMSDDGKEIRFYEEYRTSRSDHDGQLAWKVVSGKLTIDYQLPSKNFFSIRFNWGRGIERFAHNWGKKLTVFIPQGVKLEGLKVTSVSASIDANDLEAATIDLSTVNGALNPIRLTGDNVKLSTVNGQSGAEKITCEKLKSSAVNGTIRIIEPQCREIDASTVNGKISFELPEDVSGFTAKYSTVNGGFDCAFPVTTLNKVATYGDGSVKLKMSTVNGGIGIAKVQR